MLVLGAKNKISGFHSAAYTPLTDCYAVEPGHFTLSGTYGPRKQGNGPDDLEADITFTQQETDDAGKPLQVLRSRFSLVPAGGVDGFWLISTKTEHKDLKVPAVELVSGEAIRVPGK
jgi:hypothetical protein